MLRDFEIQKLKGYLAKHRSSTNEPLSVTEVHLEHEALDRECSDSRKVEDIKHRIRTGQLPILNPSNPLFETSCFNIAQNIQTAALEMIGNSDRLSEQLSSLEQTDAVETETK